MKKQNKAGISLVMLVITILVLLILAGATIISISNGNIINNTKKVTFINNVKSYMEEYDNWVSVKKMKLRGNFNAIEINASSQIAYNGEYLQDIIGNILDEDIEKFEIIGGKLVYTGNGVTDIETLENETNWAKEAGANLINEALGEEDTIVFVNTEKTSMYDNIKIYGSSENGVTGLSEITLTVTQNLIDNGFGEYKDITNFLSWSSAPTSIINLPNEKIKGSISSFYTETPKGYSDTNSEKILIDTNKKYDLSMWMKPNVVGEQIYSGIFEFDIDEKIISAHHILFLNNTLTYLTQDLKNGDTVVHLADVSGFKNTTSIYNLGLIFWNYEDSTGHLYEPLTYSRNVKYELFDSENIDRTNNTITLNSAWDMGTFEAGTKVSQSNSGYTYNDGLHSSICNSTEWEYRHTTYEGISYNIDYGTKFRCGTKYVKWFIMPNYNNKAGGGATVANIIFAESDKYNKEYSIDMTGHEPLRAMEDGTSDYIDYKNKRIVRCVGVSGSSLYRLDNETYETIELPTLPIFEANTAITINQTGRLEGTYVK